MIKMEIFEMFNKFHWMEQEWGKTGIDTLRAIKKVLDPNNILNPGKIYVNTWKKEGGDN